MKIVRNTVAILVALAACSAAYALGVADPLLALAGLHSDQVIGLMMLANAPVALPELKALVETIQRGFEEFKRTNDERLAKLAKGEAVSDLDAKLAKIEKDLDKGEALSQRMTAAEQELKAAKLAAEEAKTSAEEAERKLNRQIAGGGGNPAQLKAGWDNWARAVVTAHLKGEPNLGEAQRKALDDAAQQWKAMSVQNDATGGYLAPVEFVREIIKSITEVSPMRSLVRVRTTASKSVQMPKRTGQFAAVWVAEQGTRSETDGLRYGMLEIPTHEIYALVDISEQNLEDSAWNMADEIQMEATEQFAVAEGAAVVSGNGVGKPEGFLNNGDVGTTNVGSSAVSADGLITLKHAVKTFYARNGVFTLNRTTLASVRKLKDSQNQYLWMPGLAQGKPNTIDGDPYVEVPDMPSEGAATKAVAYGDFQRAYTLVDRIQMVMLRDPFTQATSGNVRFIFRRRQGGQVVLPEAIRIGVCS
jgi:HK97 family phage major capsid protein